MSFLFLQASRKHLGSNRVLAGPSRVPHVLPAPWKQHRCRTAGAAWSPGLAMADRSQNGNWVDLSKFHEPTENWDTLNTLPLSIGISPTNLVVESGALHKWGLGMIRNFCEFQTFESSEQSRGPQWVVGTVPTGRLFFRGMKLKTRDYGNLTNFVEDIWKPQLGPWGLWNHRKTAEICNSPSAFLYTICLDFLQYINRQ